jgi:DNA processing protein
MNTLEGKAWHTLSRAKGVGPKALWRIADYLSNRSKTASWLLENPGKITDALGVSKAGFEITDFVVPKNGEIEKLPGREVTLLYPLHPDFPQQIKNLKDLIPLPALLYARGNVAILNRPSVSIVGRRDAGKPALAVADSLTCELVAKGINITSGYAAGIDSAAHLAALRAGGTTSMVLSEGIHHFHTKPELKDHLTVDNILIISQFEPDAKWASYMAMTRNKLVCALSGAVLVIVSGPERDANGRNSGTFNAGIAALKMGIPVFVVSPSFFVDSPPGNRQLIAKGCREWDPASGTAPILAAIDSNSDIKPPPRQLNLFKKIED